MKPKGKRYPDHVKHDAVKRWEGEAMIVAIATMMAGLGAMLREFADAADGAIPQSPYCCVIATWHKEDPQRNLWVSEDDGDTWPGVCSEGDGAAILRAHFGVQGPLTPFAGGIMDGFDAKSRSLSRNHASYQNGYMIGQWCRGLAGYGVAQ